MLFQISVVDFSFDLRTPCYYESARSWGQHGWTACPCPHKHSAGLPVHSRTSEGSPPGGDSSPLLARPLRSPALARVWWPYACRHRNPSVGRAKGSTRNGLPTLRSPGAGEVPPAGASENRTHCANGTSGAPLPTERGAFRRTERVVTPSPPRNRAYQPVRGEGDTSSSSRCIVQGSRA